MRILLWAGLGLLAACPSFARDTQGPDLPPMVVTATRWDTPADRVIAPVTVIDRDEIERSLATDVAELLRFHGGIEISRNGGPGQVASVFIRGAESDHTLVLLDGVRINAGTSAIAAVQNISPEVIERIEIVKGPRSAQWGSDAIGGVINIITRAAERPFTASGEAGGGRYGTRQAAGELAAAGARGSAALAVSRLETDGFPTFEASREDAAYDNLTVNVRGELELGPLALSAGHWQATGNTEYADFFLVPQDQDYTNRVSRLGAEAWPVAGWETRLTLSRMVDDIEQGPRAANPADFTRTERVTADWQNSLELPGATRLLAGLYHSDEQTSGIIFGAPLEAEPGAGDVDIDVNAAYLQLSGRIGRHELLAAGRRSDHDLFGAETSWNLEYGLQVTAETRFTAGAGRAFRAPSSLDLYGFGGNPELQPEIARSWDAAVIHDVDARQQIRLGVFSTRIDHLIEFFVTDPDTFLGQNRNVEEARIEGLELSWRYRGERWDARAEATVQSPRNESDDSRLLRRADHSLTLGLSRRFGPHELGLDLLAAGDRVDFGGAGLAGYVLANLTARVRLGGPWLLKARVENLLDTDYRLAAGYRTAGRGLYATLSYVYR